MQPQTPTLVENILALYQLTPSRIEPPQKGYRNTSYAAQLENDTTVNLMLYKREEGILQRIRNANNVSDFLASRGFPARQTLSPRIVRLTSPTTVRYGAIYNYLPGTTIPWEAYTMEHIKLLGATMAQLHDSLRDYPEPETLPRITDEYLATIKRMIHYFADPNVTEALNQKLRIIISFQLLTRHRHLLLACANLPKQQVLHMDLVRSNILFATSATPQVTGIIDFEKTSYGHPLFDIARTLAFLLVDCKFKTEAQVKKYFLYSGYRKRGNVTIEQPAILNELTNLFLLHDFYKFLRHNPYESLHENEHFVRTRDILLQRHLIESLQETPVTGDPL